MKKIFAIVASLALVAGTASAQSKLSDILNGISNAATNATSSTDSSAASTASGILNSILNTVASSTTTPSLKGDWTYNGVATVAGTGSTLTDIAANAAMEKVETKLDENLKKVGITPGAASFSFLEDGTFTLVTEKMSYPGTWTQDGTAVTLKFGKVLGLLSMEGTVSTTTEGVDVVFQANKFLTFVKTILSKLNVKNTNSSIATLSTLMSQIQELNAGFKLVKA